MEDASIASRTFSESDQLTFARFSGDWNAIHMDPVAARRTQSGERVVHGVSGLLWLLDALCEAGEDFRWVRGLKVQFQSFLTLDQQASVRVSRRAGGLLKAELVSNGVVLTVVTLSSRPPRAQDPGPGAMADGRSDEPVEMTLEEMAAARGVLATPDATVSAALYPHIVAAWGTDVVASLAGLSTLVGMVCPGRHSLFAGFNLSIGAPAGDIAWRVARTDDRFRMIWMDVRSGDLWGEVTAFVRQPPVDPPGFAAAAGRVPADAFAGMRALIIGGSRGLGAAAGMLLAAGGATLTLTYVSGESEAADLIAAINAGRSCSAATAIRVDVRQPVETQLEQLVSPPTHILYFATSRIGGGQTHFDPRVHAGLFDMHVTGLVAVLEWAEAHSENSCIHVLTPSSVFVESRPPGMTEYAMVKTAMEVLCLDWTATRPNMTICTPRLPRILTDQTATTPPVPAENVLDVLPEILLQFARR